MMQVQANGLKRLILGRQGENLARQIVFDVSGWEKEYGPGIVELIFQRNRDEQAYPVATERDGSNVIWTVTATDTEHPGENGHCELRYYVGETLAKSQVWSTRIIPAIPTPTAEIPPETEQGWVDQVVAVGAAAKASAEAAKADADRAKAIAQEVAENAAQTAQDATESAQAKEAAQTAQRLAEEAQSAAEAARNAAETAQVAAERSATDAAGAKQGAEAALKAAQDAAAAAAQALADLRALYQEMQTWAQGVIQDVNDAGSAAVQSVQSAGDTQVQRVTDEGATQTANAKAQANAAAQSASGAAQSAQQAAESAAVYDNVVTDVTQLKQDLSVEQTAREQADTSLQQEISSKLPKSPADWEAWTAEEQAAARKRIGEPQYELIEEITLEEEALFYRETEPNGEAYNFKKILINIITPPYGNSNRWGSITFNKTASILLSKWTAYNVNNYIGVVGEIINGRFFATGGSGSTNPSNLGITGYNPSSYGMYTFSELKSIRFEKTLPIGANIKIYGVRA